MSDLNLIAVAASAAACFLVGAFWNGVFSGRLQRARGVDAPSNTTMPAWSIVAELLRCALGATVLALLFALANVTNVGGAVLMGGLIWVGFQAALLSGAVIWEKMSPAIFTIHAGDALVKMAVMSTLLGLWA